MTTSPSLAPEVVSSTRVAQLLAQADLLPRIRAHARAAARPDIARLALLGSAGATSQATGGRDPDRAEEMARLLVDASIVTRILDSGTADREQHIARAEASAVVEREPGLSPARRDAVIEAADALARMRCLAAALETPSRTAQVRHRAARLRDALAAWPVPVPGPTLAAARTATLARAAASALAERRSVLDTARVAEGRSRRIRIDDLGERLVAGAHPPGASGAPTGPPADEGLLAWLRNMVCDQRLYDPAAEEAATAWLGTDILGHRRPSARPDFLAELDPRTLPAELVAPFPRRLSLTRPAPVAADLTPAAFAADAGTVSRAERDADAHRPGSPSPATTSESRSPTASVGSTPTVTWRSRRTASPTSWIGSPPPYPG
ncbi:hypothetical protein [Micromonospora craniellae]|uniref:Uncharacterized protein n=1 Tax=Micromonospora craniellae TaxID=2294034 RepID=A0A372FXQ5_9ACTN|nr:hypothetical protein [Micromonospora craniellae]RFS45572.1 hypothetical protein D0Q02_15845 [Micromonospora craniellae]